MKRNYFQGLSKVIHLLVTCWEDKQRDVNYVSFYYPN